jgi:hypothetical protein
MPSKKTRPKTSHRDAATEQEFYDELHRLLQAPFEGEFPELRRWIEVHALGIRFMQYLGIEDHLVDKAMVWLEALVDREEGVAAPILTVTRKGEAPPTSAVWRARAALVIAYDYLVAAEMPEARALTKVADTPGIEKLLRRKGSTAEGSVKSWRQKLGEKSVSNDLANERWDASRVVIAAFKKAVADDPASKGEAQEKLKAEAERLIAAAIEEIGQL